MLIDQVKLFEEARCILVSNFKIQEVSHTLAILQIFPRILDHGACSSCFKVTDATQNSRGHDPYLGSQNCIFHFSDCKDGCASFLVGFPKKLGQCSGIRLRSFVWVDQRDCISQSACGCQQFCSSKDCQIILDAVHVGEHEFEDLLRVQALTCFLRNFLWEPLGHLSSARAYQLP